MKLPFFAICVFILVAVAFDQQLLYAQNQEQTADDTKVVEKTKQLLGKQFGRKYPWYDSETDSAKFIPFPVDRNNRSKEPRNFAKWDILSIITNALVIIGIALLLWIIIWLVIKFFPGLQNLTPEGQNDEKQRKRRLETLPVEARDDMNDLLGAAWRAFESGDLRQAVILYFSFQLLELDKNELIRLHRGKTNREYSRELKNRINIRVLYEQAMYLFERVYFGEHKINRSEFLPLWDSREQFMAAIKQQPNEFRQT